MLCINIWFTVMHLIRNKIKTKINLFLMHTVRHIITHKSRHRPTQKFPSIKTREQRFRPAHLFVVIASNDHILVTQETNINYSAQCECSLLSQIIKPQNTFAHKFKGNIIIVLEQTVLPMSTWVHYWNNHYSIKEVVLLFLCLNF